MSLRPRLLLSLAALCALLFAPIALATSASAEAHHDRWATPDGKLKCKIVNEAVGAYSDQAISCLLPRKHLIVKWGGDPRYWMVRHATPRQERTFAGIKRIATTDAFSAGWRGTSRTIPSYYCAAAFSGGFACEVVDGAGMGIYIKPSGRIDICPGMSDPCRIVRQG